MRLIIYEEEDRFARQVAVALHGLASLRRKGQFNDFQHVARERVWNGTVFVTDKLGTAAEYPLQIAAVSIGPDYDALLKACQTDWVDVVRLQTWKPDCGKPQPKRLMRFIPGSPVTVLIRDVNDFWVAAKAAQWHKKCEDDARRVALQIIETLLVRKESWMRFQRAKSARADDPDKRRLRTPQTMRPYFAEPA